MSSTIALLLLCALAMAHTSLAAQLAASADGDSASISGHTPFGGPAPGGTSVTVIGDRVGEGTSCAFGNHAVPATRVNDSAVTCTAPALQLADARQDVCLLVQLAGENTTCATYTYYQPPVIARFFPWAMPAFNTEDTQVLLYGKGFANTQGVPGANAIRCEVGGSLWPGDCAVVNDTTLKCFSSDYCRGCSAGGFTDLRVKVTLNEQDYSVAQDYLQFYWPAMYGNYPEPGALPVSNQLAVIKFPLMSQGYGSLGPIKCKIGDEVMHGSIWRNDQQQLFLMCQGFLRTPGAFPAKVAWNGVNFGAMNLLEDFFVYEPVVAKSVSPSHGFLGYATEVTVSLTNFSSLPTRYVDTGFPRAQCRWGSPVPGRYITTPGRGAYPGVRCTSPLHLPSGAVADASGLVSLPVAVSLNGANYSKSSLSPPTFAFTAPPAYPGTCSSETVCSNPTDTMCQSGYCEDSSPWTGPATCQCIFGWGGEDCHTNIQPTIPGLDLLTNRDEFTCPTLLIGANEVQTWTWVNIGLGSGCLLLLLVLAIPLPDRGCNFLRLLHRLVGQLDFKMALVHLSRAEEPSDGGHSNGSDASGRGGGTHEAESGSPAQGDVRRRTALNTQSTVHNGRSASGFAAVKGHLAAKLPRYFKDHRAEDGDGHHGLMHVAQRRRGTFGGFITILLVCAWVSNSVYDVNQALYPQSLPQVESTAFGSTARSIPLVVYFGFDCSRPPAASATLTPNCTTMGVHRSLGTASSSFSCRDPPPKPDGTSGQTYCSCTTVPYNSQGGQVCIVKMNDTALTQEEFAGPSQDDTLAAVYGLQIMPEYFPRLNATAFPQYVFMSAESLTVEGYWLGKTDGLNTIQMNTMYRSKFCSRISFPTDANPIAVQERYMEGFFGVQGGQLGSQPSRACRYYDTSYAFGQSAVGVYEGNTTVQIHGNRVALRDVDEPTDEALSGVQFQWDWGGLQQATYGSPLTPASPAPPQVQLQILLSSKKSVRTNLQPASSSFQLFLRIVALAGSYVGAHGAARFMWYAIWDRIGVKGCCGSRSTPRCYVACAPHCRRCTRCMCSFLFCVPCWRACFRCLRTRRPRPHGRCRQCVWLSCCCCLCGSCCHHAARGVRNEAASVATVNTSLLRPQQAHESTHDAVAQC